MSPIPNEKQEKKLHRRIYLTNGHVIDDGKVYWDIDHPRLWKNVCTDFHKQVLDTGGQATLSLPLDCEAQVDALRAWIRLARVALRQASPEERAIVREWIHPLVDERGSAELMRHGLLHSDKLKFAVAWDNHNRFIRHSHSILPPQQLVTFVEAFLISTIYESTVMCGMVFLSGLADLMKNGSSDPRSKLWEKGAKVPFLDKAANGAVRSLGGRWPRSPEFTASDRRVLRELALAMNQRQPSRSPPGVPSDLRWIRDSLAHGKFEIGDDGGMTFDIYEHRLVRMQTSRRRGTSHRYQYTQLQPRNTREMRSVVHSFAIVIWAVYKECERLLLRDVTHRTPPVDADSLKAARRAIRRSLVKAGDKRLAKEKAAAERRARLARINVKVTVERG